MTESRILELLARNVGENTSGLETLHFSKLSPGCVQHISKNIADILYRSLTTKSASNENKRLDIVSLLQKWCSNNGNHFKIGQDNYDCVVNSLINASNLSLLDNDDLQIRIELDDRNETCKPNCLALIIRHCRKVELINKEKLKFRDIVRNRDRRKCGDDNIFISSLLHEQEYNDTCDNFFGLEHLLHSQGCEETISLEKTNEHKQFQNPKTETSLMREKQINLAYSLLNLKRSDRDMLLLTNILKNISAYDNLEPCEVTFINYLWVESMHGSLQTGISLLLLENFPFIYEKVLIKACADALRTKFARRVPPVSKDVQKVLDLSSDNKKLRNNIKSLFYELYSYSGFNNKLGCFQTLFK